MKQLLILLSLIVAIVFGQTERPVSFAGHQVFVFDIENWHQLASLRYQMPEDLDIWTPTGLLSVGQNHVRINPHNEAHTAFLYRAKSLGIQLDVMIQDLQKLIDLERKPAPGLANSFYSNYHTYDEMKAYCKDLCTSFGNICAFIPSIGKSVQQRDIFALRIGRNANENSTNVNRIYFQAGQHAREWIGPITLTYIVEQLLTGKDAEIADILQKIEIDVVPLVNPDGYTYAWTTDRMWRKNRRVNSGSSCAGVDLNRNWDTQWATVGSSSNPCSDTYHGTRAFSEPESTAVSSWITAMNAQGSFDGAIDFHSFSQLFLRPYGWTSKNCPDETALKVLGAGVVAQLRDVYGTQYQNIRSVDLYPTSGSASDWFYEAASIWASYTIELRDTGRYGFVLPASQILPSGNETWSAIKFYISTVVSSDPR